MVKKGKKIPKVEKLTEEQIRIAKEEEKIRIAKENQLRDENIRKAKEDNIREAKEKKVLENIEKGIRTKGPDYIEDESSRSYIRPTLYGLAGIIGIALIILFILSIQTNSIPITDYVTHNRTLSKTVIVPINISQYLIIADRNPQSFSEVAYLGQEIENRDGMSYLHKYLQDDYGNRINVTLGYAAIKLYDNVFPKEGISNDTYLVTGTITASIYRGVILEINAIVQKDKQTSIQYYTEKYYELENTTSNRKHISINVTQGINKILGR